MICPECGSYQPDKAKFCGNCGAGLSRDSLVESFLGSLKPQEMEIPKRRSLAFYLGVMAVVLLGLAVLGGMTWLVYRYAVRQKERPAEEPGEEYLVYTHPGTGFSITYHRHFELRERAHSGDDLVSLELVMGSEKSLEIEAFRLDPDVLVGGMESISSLLKEDALTRMKSVGGEIANFLSAGTEGGVEEKEGRGDIPPEVFGTDEEAELLNESSVKGNPAFYADLKADVYGFLIFYLISDDIVFVFTGKSPWGEFPTVRRQFMAVIGSFRRETS